MMTGEVVYFQAGKRRKIHRASRVGSVLLTAEGCNIDVSGDRKELAADTALKLIAAYPTKACRRCGR